MEAKPAASKVGAGKVWRPGVEKTLAGLREYLLLFGEPDTRLNPKWLAHRLGLPEQELPGALAYAVRDGLVEMNWEVYSHDATADRGEPAKKSCRRSGGGARYMAYRAAHSAFTAPLRSFTESFGIIVVMRFLIM